MGGLLDRDLEYIRKSLQKFPEIQRALIFGSRAIGNYKKGSDVDLTIVGSTITHKIVVELSDLLNEIYPLPYIFDIHHYDSISNENLKNHIDIFGKEIYSRDLCK